MEAYLRPSLQILTADIEKKIIREGFNFLEKHGVSLFKQETSIAIEK